jgi:ADP-heptose:LPS heptosyltransferase
VKGWAGVARLGGVGDNLVSASVLRPLKSLGYNTEVITSPMASVVYLNNPFLDKLSIKGDGDLPGGADWQKWFISRSREYDLFAHLSHSMEVRHALFPDSTAFWTRPEYRRKLCAGNYLETVHDVMGVPYEFGPLFFPTDEEKDKAQQTKANQIGERYVAWVIAGSRLDKVYQYSGHAICRIIKELGVSVVLFGKGQQQLEMAVAIKDNVAQSLSNEKGLHTAIADWSGATPGGDKDWSLRRCLAQVLAADVVVSPDTGIAWAAAFEPMPKIIMVSHASPENITKHWTNTTTLHADPSRVPCWPCHRLHNDMSTCVSAKDNPNSSACMTDIKVETVVQEIGKALAQEKSNVLQWPGPAREVGGTI